MEIFLETLSSDDDCAYNISSIEESASRVYELIQHEMSLPSIGSDPSKVYLAGFSEGAQLTAYMQIAKLTFALTPPILSVPLGATTKAAVSKVFL